MAKTSDRQILLKMLEMQMAHNEILTNLLTTLAVNQRTMTAPAETLAGLDDRPFHLANAGVAATIRHLRGDIRSDTDPLGGVRNPGGDGDLADIDAEADGDNEHPG
jgi:hypothetical protein